MAELIAIISSLSGLSIRQDIAITGSMNQFGLAQSIGGVHLKVEGFHRVCVEQGLTGTQGVIIPRSNIIHLTLRENIVDDIRAQKFFIWPVDSVYEAMEILMSKKCGLKLQNGMPSEREYPYYHFEQNSILSLVLRQLERYNKSVRLMRHGG